MPAENNKTIAVRLYAAFNSRDIEVLNELLAPNFIDHTASPGQAPGRAGMQEVWSSLFESHPAIRATMRDMLAEDDTVATRVAFEGMSTPSGGAIMLEIMRIADGHIAALWNVITMT